MSALLNDASCGPINPLQGLTKTLDRDRGVSQDQFGTSQAGPSRQTFRTQTTTPNPSLRLEANRFFGASPLSSQQATPQFDISSLNSQLSRLHVNRPQSQTQQVPVPNWALQFQKNAPPPVAQASSSRSAWRSEFQDGEQFSGPSATAPLTQQTPMMQQPFHPIVASQPFGGGVPMHWNQVQPPMAPLANNAQVEWDTQFENASQAQVEPVTESIPHEIVTEDLSATAGLLVSSIAHEQNPKFINSEFMNLMKRLRDKEVIVQGNDMVENSSRGVEGWASQLTADVKGKGRAIDVNTPAGFIQPTRLQPGYQSGPMLTGQGYQTRAQELGQTMTQELSEEEEPALLGTDYLLRHKSTNGHWIDAEWGRLQQDWEEFEATTVGVRPVGSTLTTNYSFQENNPYMALESNQSHIARTSLPYQSVLQTEAEVQRDPQNATAWLSLGVKQQENEREDKAIQALNQAVTLDPTLLPAWLALAVSYTNESDRESANRAITQWIEGNTKYRNAVATHRTINKESIEALQADENSSPLDKQKELLECLMTMARMGAPEVDADVQIALGVLLNSSEEYEKAQDCFRAALAVRPEDWLLYNRVGATLANSGKSNEALQYYYRALELNSSYTRARYNLGIACINLRMFEEAAEHILDALVLQESDTSAVTGEVADGAGLSSSALWDSLKTTCVHMQRFDLVGICEKKDLNGFQLAFVGGRSQPSYGEAGSPEYTF